MDVVSYLGVVKLKLGFGILLEVGVVLIMFKSIFRSGFFRVNAVLLSLGATLIVTRILSVEEAGLYFLGFTISTVLSIVFRFGLDNLIIRTVAAEKGEGVNSLIVGLVWVCAASLVVLPLLYFFSNIISVHVFRSPSLESVLELSILSVFPVVIYSLVGFFYVGSGKLGYATMFQGAASNALFIGVVLLLLEYIDSAEDVMCLYVLSSYATCLLSITLFIVSVKLEEIDVHLKLYAIFDLDLLNSARHLWVAACLALMVQWGGVLIAGAFLSTEDYAGLSVAIRISSMITILLTVFNMVLAPRYASLWSEGDLASIESVARRSKIIIVFLVSPIVFASLFLSDMIMGFFGSEYEEYSSLLIVLVIGQVVNVSTGSVGYLLNMTGNENYYSRALLLTAPTSVSIMILLSYTYSAVGAAVAVAFGVALQNLICFYYVRMRLGFFP